MLKIEVKAIVPMAKALNLGVVLERTQKELGGFPVAAKDYVEKHLSLCDAQIFRPQGLKGQCLPPSFVLRSDLQYIKESEPKPFLARMINERFHIGLAPLRHHS